MPIHRYFLSDFVTIQRQSFFDLLEKGLIEEFSKRNPITNGRKDYSFFFYPEYYILTRPEYKPYEAIIKNKSYTSKLYVPVQITNKKEKQIILKWVYIGNIPLMTKRGHFILNGAARVIVNQILRSPGIYYQQKIYENYEDRQGSKSNKKEEDSTTGDVSSLKPVNTYKRFYCDLICMRGSWLRIEMDKEKNIWAQMKKGPKIPIYWFLLAMGLSEKVIIKSILDPQKVFGNLEKNQRNQKASKSAKKNSKVEKENLDTQHNLDIYNSTELDKKQGNILEKKQNNIDSIEEDKPKKTTASTIEVVNFTEGSSQSSQFPRLLRNAENSSKKQNYAYLKNTAEAWEAMYKLLHSKTKTTNIEVANSKEESSQSSRFPRFLRNAENGSKAKDKDESVDNDSTYSNQNRTTKDNTQSKISKGPVKNLTELGRQWLYNRFMNPRSYDLGKQGRIAFNKKLGLTIASKQLTLTGLDVLYATDYLIKVEKGIFKTDDIDHLKNRRVRTSGELIQIQIGVGLVRLEKFIRYNENMLESKRKELMNIEFPSRVNTRSKANGLRTNPQSKNLDNVKSNSTSPEKSLSRHRLLVFNKKRNFHSSTLFNKDLLRGEAYLSLKRPVRQKMKSLTSSSIINNKAFNSAIREFFGTSPLSQFMDQINPLAELTHKRRLSSMGPGGVTRDNATLAIRGIHPTHYGRICPIETPEGKNTGLVNSMTTYARVNPAGILESPFYKVYKGQVQKNTGMYYLNAEQEERIKLAAPDLFVSPIGFIPKAMIPARIAETFTKISRSSVQFIGVSPLQMISIAASLIPFLEHDDANRALMGSNMQRQAVPLIRHERPIVGTGLEGRAVSDSGHVIQSKYSGLVTYVSSKKIVVSTK